MNALNIRGSKSTLLSAVAGLALSMGAGIAAAGTPSRDVPPTVTAKYDSSDLATKAGAEALYSRIRFAARMVCEHYKTDELVRRVPWQKCYSLAVDYAVAAVHQPILTALHESRVNANRHG